MQRKQQDDKSWIESESDDSDFEILEDSDFDFISDADFESVNDDADFELLDQNVDDCTAGYTAHSHQMSLLAPSVDLSTNSERMSESVSPDMHNQEEERSVSSDMDNQEEERGHSGAPPNECDEPIEYHHYRTFGKLRFGVLSNKSRKEGRGRWRMYGIKSNKKLKGGVRVWQMDVRAAVAVGLGMAY